MHLKLSGKEASNGRECGTQDNADNKCQDNLAHDGHGGEVESDAKHGTGVWTGVHDDGRRHHTHTDHTANRQVGTSLEDQAGDAKCQEHTGRSCWKMFSTF